jgi:membrane protein insertase Oxa1/YidC/SpoIIIJ
MVISLFVSYGHGVQYVRGFVEVYDLTFNTILHIGLIAVWLNFLLILGVTLVSQFTKNAYNFYPFQEFIICKVSHFVNKLFWSCFYFVHFIFSYASIDYCIFLAMLLLTITLNLSILKLSPKTIHVRPSMTKVKEDKDLTSGLSKVQSINSLEVVTTRYFTFSISPG